MSNFIPNETKKFSNRTAPWITPKLKTLINRKNRFYKGYKRRGYKIEDKLILDTLRDQCQQEVSLAKHSYLNRLGNKLHDPRTSQKSYWKLINKLMNKCRTTIIPPLLVNNNFILNCQDKAKLFNEFFSHQCKPIKNDSVLPMLNFLTFERIDSILVSDSDILSLIRNLNPKKANGPDGISCQMLLLCDNSVVLPLKIIFENIISSSVYPDSWKIANLTPIHKKKATNS